MSTQPDDPHRHMRDQLTRAGQLHWFHWLIVAMSAALTMSAWWFVSTEHDEKVEIRFHEETSRVRELLVERMERYEDGLRAGVAFLQAHDIDADFDDWKRYADAIDIHDKYPGINGFGVIHAVPREADARQRYLDWQRDQRPGFAIHPPHEQPELLPISYVVPVEGNEKAVGLDIAHESNRYQGAVKARETGMPQITGPIILVQDARQTPGFLFFAPFYRSEGSRPPATAAARRAQFAGAVYAPFVVRELIDGALRPQQRLVRIRLQDGDSVLYSELDDGHEALLVAEQRLEMYGRSWQLRIETTPDFDTAVHSQQPMFILALGIVVDSLLLWFFVALSRANRRAVTYADEVVAHLRDNESQLARRNEELMQFNYRTSHDLVAPLNTVRGFVSLAVDDIEQGDYGAVGEWLSQIDDQCMRLIELTTDLLSLARAQHDLEDAEEIDLDGAVAEIRQGLRQTSQDADVTIHSDCAITPPLRAPRRRLLQVLENLISNAVRYADPAKDSRWVRIHACRPDRGGVELTVADNGIGIPADIQQSVFAMFFRGPGATASGSGLGLYIVQQHVEKMGAQIFLRSGPEGSAFTVYFPEEHAT